MTIHPPPPSSRHLDSTTAPSVPSFLIYYVDRAPPPRLHYHRRGLQEHADSCFPIPTVSAWLTTRYVFDEMRHGVAAYLNQ